MGKPKVYVAFRGTYQPSSGEVALLKFTEPVAGSLFLKTIQSWYIPLNVRKSPSQTTYNNCIVPFFLKSEKKIHLIEVNI